MPDIDDIQNFITTTGATAISPIPAAGPAQRGPTCGFYALAYIMLSWFERQQQSGEDYGLKKPLEARTHNEEASDARMTAGQRFMKKRLAQYGQFSSLRHYGKHHQLTAYGSVFNAENIVKVARGNGSHYGGQYDGHITDVKSADDFAAKVKALIDAECPVIVPFDVDDNGDPTTLSGKAAHWTDIIGTYQQNATDYAIHYHWGKFHYSELGKFGESNGQLTANAFLDLKKCEATHHNLVTVRDFMTDESIKAYKKLGYSVKVLAGPVSNYEFCKPKSVEHLKAVKELTDKFPDLEKCLAADKLKANGFDRMNLANAGLKGKIVAVYPAVKKKSILASL